MPRVVHFEIPADNPDRACAFYRDVFAWQVQTWPGPVQYYLARTGAEGEPGIDGAIMPRPAAGQGQRCTIGVDSVDDYLEKVRQAGGTVLGEKMAIPGMGWVAFFSDSEGNSLMLHRRYAPVE